MPRRPRASGSALLVTLIVVLVMLVMVVGTIQFTSGARVVSASKLREDRTTACVDAARNYVVSRLSIFGVQATDMSLVGFKDLTVAQTLPDDPDPTKRINMLTGHYATDGGSAPEATVVEVASSEVGSSQRDIRELGNASPTSRTFGQVFRVIVKCQEPIPAGASASYVPRQSELEFEFKYGGL